MDRILIIEENSMIPLDRRVWYEATALQDAAWQVTVICPAAKGAHMGNERLEYSRQPEDLDGITVYWYPQTFAESGVADFLNEYVTAFSNTARLSWKIWRERGFDIVHICNPPDIFFPIGLFYRILGAKFVFDHHDLFPEGVEWRYRGLVRWFLYATARAMEFMTFRAANVVIATNESFKEIAQKRGKVATDKVVVVRNGPKIGEFVPVEPIPALKRRFPYMVCYVGVMGAEDGILEAVESIRYIVQSLGQRDILFVLIGDGASRPQAEKNLSAWDLEGFVDMPGFIRDDHLLRQYLSTSDVCVSPEPLTPMNSRSTFVKVAEYMAMGKPIVAYDLKETRATAQDSACYVTPGDVQGFGQAIVDLLENPVRRQRMGEIGRQRVLDSLGWEHQQQQLFHAYRLAFGEKGE
jgi:glycosyltransferase involved in cell wall biosynthesis